MVLQVILFEIDCAIFYTNLHELFCQFISWTSWVNSGKFMDNCWISCQVMADMKKVYDNLIIINLYNIKYWQSMIRTHNIVHSLLFIFLAFSFLGLNKAFRAILMQIVMAIFSSILVAIRCGDFLDDVLTPFKVTYFNSSNFELEYLWSCIVLWISV